MTLLQDKIDKFVCKIRAGHPLPNPKSQHATRELAPDEKAVDSADSVMHFQADTESEARGRLLVYMLQNGMFKKSDVPEQKAADVSARKSAEETKAPGEKS